MAADDSGTTIAGDQVGGSKYVLSGDLRQATITIIEGGVPVATIPWQQPPPATHFTGRGMELERLLAELRPGRVVALYGPGGIGKTALAAEAIAALLPSPLGRGASPPPGRGTEVPALFPDGVVFHTFYGRPAAVEAAAEIARAYGLDPNPDPLAAMTAALGRRVALLVLDGAEAADDLGALLDRRGGCGVLITSRRREDAARAGARIEVERLPPDEALALLRALAGARGDDETAGRAICELVGNLPLAVRLAGRYLFVEQQSAAGYLAWLRATPLAALDFGARRRDSVPVLLARSAAQVSAAARAALGVAGCLALAPFDLAPVAAALALGDHDARRALGELVNYELLRRPGERYEVSHALVHTYARERGAAGAAAVGRLGAYYNTLARTERARGLPGYARLGPERGHILAVLARLGAVEAWETANSLVWAVAGHRGWLDMQGYPRDRIAALEVGLAAARALGNRRDESAHLTHLGLAYAALGQVERAIAQYEAALAIDREIGDRRGEGSDLFNRALALEKMGRQQEAVQSAAAALAVFESIDAPNEADAARRLLARLRGEGSGAG